jgi:hypothetical protein
MLYIYDTAAILYATMCRYSAILFTLRNKWSEKMSTPLLSTLLSDEEIKYDYDGNELQAAKNVGRKFKPLKHSGNYTYHIYRLH